MKIILINLVKRQAKKLNTLARISNYIAFNERNIIMNAFFTSQFSYCPPVSRFPSKRLGKKVNALHERVLKMIYGDKTSSFNKLSENDNPV